MDPTDPLLDPDPPMAEGTDNVVLPPDTPCPDPAIAEPDLIGFRDVDPFIMNGIFQFPEAVVNPVQEEFKLASDACEKLKAKSDTTLLKAAKTKYEKQKLVPFLNKSVGRLDFQGTFKKAYFKARSEKVGDKQFGIIVSSDSDESKLDVENCVRLFGLDEEEEEEVPELPETVPFEQEMKVEEWLVAQPSVTSVISNDSVDKNIHLMSETEIKEWDKKLEKQEEHKKKTKTKKKMDWIHSEIIKLQTKLCQARIADLRYRKEVQRLCPRLQFGRIKKIGKKAMKFRRKYTEIYEICNALGDSSEYSEIEDYVYKPYRPESSTSGFDLDSDDIHPTEKHLFEMQAEEERPKAQIKGVESKTSLSSIWRNQHQERASALSTPSFASPPGGAAKQVIYPDYRTRTRFKPEGELRRKPLPVLEELKKRTIPFIHQPNSLERFAAARREDTKAERQSLSEEIPLWNLFANSKESYCKMMGRLQPKKKPVPLKAPPPPPAPAPKTPRRLQVDQRRKLTAQQMKEVEDFFIPNTQTSSVTKLPPISSEESNYSSSRKNSFSLSQGKSQGHPKVVVALKTSKRPLKTKLQPIWLEPEKEDQNPASPLRIPNLDGTYSYWRPRQNPAWTVRCTSAGDRIPSGREAQYSYEPVPVETETYPESLLPPTPLKNIQSPKFLTYGEQQAKRLQEISDRREAQKRVVKFVAPTANWNLETPIIRADQIRIGFDEILAKVSYLQYETKTIEEQLKYRPQLKNHLIVRVVRLGGAIIQKGLQRGVLAWAKCGKGQRLKASFMEDLVDFFIYQLEDLSFFYNDLKDPFEMPKICGPRTPNQ